MKLINSIIIVAIGLIIINEALKLAYMTGYINGSYSEKLWLVKSRVTKPITKEGNVLKYPFRTASKETTGDTDGAA